MVTVKDIEKGSYASKASILPGDILVSVNGNEIADVLDYRYYTTDKKLKLSLLRDGSEISVSITKKGRIR